MRTRLAVAPILIALVLAACGSGGGSGPSRTWRVVLKPIPGMSARSASASATIRLLSSRAICWSFRDVTGVAHPTLAHINAGTAGAYGTIVVPLGSRYKASGCTKSLAADLTSQIAFSAQAFYVVIENRSYASVGAVRAQL